MRDLKRFLAVFVAVAVLLTAMVPAFAATSFANEDAAKTLNNLGLYAGVDGNKFDPDLGTALDRQTGVSMIVKLFGKEAEANAMGDKTASILARFSDADQIVDWAKPFVAYAVENGLVVGRDDGKFDPKANLKGKDFATMILRNLGYEPNYDKAAAELSDVGGLSASDALNFNDKSLIKDDLVGISFSALQAKDQKGETLIAKLIAAEVVAEDTAVEAGVYTPEVDEEELAAQEAATKAVEAYEAAEYDTAEKIAAADVLRDAAREAIEKVTDEKVKKELSERVDMQETAVDGSRMELSPAEVKITADNLKTLTIEFDKEIDAETFIVGDTIKIMYAGQNILNPISVSDNAAKINEATKLPEYPELNTNNFSQFLEGNMVFKAVLGTEDASFSLAQDTTVEVIIDGVKDTKGVEIKDFKKTVTVGDNEKPSVVKAQYLSSEKIMFTFSEPVAIFAENDETNTTVTSLVYTEDDKNATIDNKYKKGSGFDLKVDGKHIYAGFKAYPWAGSFLVYPTTKLTEGTHTITLSEVRDYSGRKMEVYEAEIVVVYDVEAPKPVEENPVEATSTTEVKVKFNEALKNDKDALKDATVQIFEIGNATDLAKGAELTVDGDTLIIKLKGNKLSAASLVSFQVIVKDIQDAAGNKSAEHTLMAKLVTDDTPLKLDSHEVRDDNIIRLVFSRKPDFDSAKITLYEAGKTDDALETYENNKEKKVDSLSKALKQAKDSEDKEIANTYDLTVNYLADKNPANYTLKIEGVKEDSVALYPMGTATFDFTSKDSLAPKLDYMIFTDNRLVLTFSESMDRSIISNINNYFVGTDDKVAATPLYTVKNAKIETISSDNTQVTIYIPAGSFGKDKEDKDILVNSLAILGAKDASGCAMTTAGAGLTEPKILDKDGYPDFVQSHIKVVATGENTFVISIKEKDEDGNEIENRHRFKYAAPYAFKFYTIKEGAESVNSGILVKEARISDDGKSITLTTANEVSGDVKVKVDDAYKNVYLAIENKDSIKVSNQFNKDLIVEKKISANIIKDEDGNVIDEGPLTITDEIKAKQKETKVLTADKSKIVVSFNEDVQLVDGANNSLLASSFVVKFDDKALVAEIDYKATIEDGDVVITITKEIGEDKEVSVQLANTTYLTDAAGNGVVAKEKAETVKVTVAE